MTSQMGVIGKGDGMISERRRELKRRRKRREKARKLRLKQALMAKGKQA